MYNPVLEELHEIRRNLQAEHQDDLTEFMHDEFARTKAAGHPIARLEQRSVCLSTAKRLLNPPPESGSE